jgi:hypothetical protein
VGHKFTRDIDSARRAVLQVAEKLTYFVIPNEVRNPSSIETQEKERFLGERRASE